MLFFLKNCPFLLFFVLKNAMTVAKRLAALSTVNLTLICDWRWDARSNKLLSVILCIQVLSNYTDKVNECNQCMSCML